MCQYFSTRCFQRRLALRRADYGNIQEATMTEKFMERTLYVK